MTTVSLDTTGPTWQAELPRLGTTQIHPDGHYSLATHAGPGYYERRQALKWGWSDPLVWRRSGHILSHAAVSHQGEGLLVLGNPKAFPTALWALHDAGCGLVADAFTPLEVRPGTHNAKIVAKPRSAPFLMPRKLAEQEGIPGVPVRNGSDLVRVHLNRPSHPVEVTAIVRVDKAQESHLEPVFGAKRVRLAEEATVQLPGENVDGQAKLELTLTFARLRMAKWSLADSSKAEQILEWWHER